MKGIIVNCLNELVRTKFGQDKWDAILQESGVDKFNIFFATDDVDDDLIFKMIDKASKVLNLPAPELFDHFGEYWSCEFAPKIYHIYYSGVSSAKALLLKMDQIHQLTTETIKNAHPPRFTYEWIDEQTLIMSYLSNRHLIDLMISLVKGVGKYYHTDLKVTKISSDKIEIKFP